MSASLETKKLQDEFNLNADWAGSGAMPSQKKPASKPACPVMNCVRAQDVTVPSQMADEPAPGTLEAAKMEYDLMCGS